MPHFKLTIAYDGTGFVGWQRQASGTSIQGLLEDALATLDGQAVTVAGASRTDAGVHAAGQVASATLIRNFDSDTVRRALNWRLPPEVRVLSVEVAAPDFHARFAASGKTYRYRIWNGEVLDPFARHTVWHVPSPKLDDQQMGAAAALLVGRHDFAAFQTSGAAVRSTERTISRSSVTRVGSGPLLVYEVDGDGFLRHMVRGIVGSLIEVGRGRVPPSWLAEVVASKSRTRGGVTAPAHGLCLMKVHYQINDL